MDIASLKSPPCPHSDGAFLRSFRSERVGIACRRSIGALIPVRGCLLSSVPPCAGRKYAELLVEPRQAHAGFAQHVLPPKPLLVQLERLLLPRGASSLTSPSRTPGRKSCLSIPTPRRWRALLASLCCAPRTHSEGNCRPVYGTQRGLTAVLRCLGDMSLRRTCSAIALTA